MSQETWSKVDAYITSALIGEDPPLAAALQASAEAGLPPISVSPPQGRFLHLLARVQQPQNILEIGTLGGYSTIWLARALQAGGHLVSLELDARHADVARTNLARAGVDHLVEIRVGAAIELLPALAAGPHAPFDFIFIDADKPRTPEYFDWAVRLSRTGSVIVVDNVVRNGALTDSASEEADVIGMRRFTERLSVDSRVSATILQTVGSKGYDGFAVAIVGADARTGEVSATRRSTADR